MSRLRVLGVALSGLALLGVVVLVAGRPENGPGPVPAPRADGPASVTDAPVVGAAALRTLRAWDRRRAQAYATGSAARLRDLYVAGSGAGAADLRLLAAYRSRGLRVVGMRTQLLTVAVLDARAGRWALRVTDRLARAFAVQDGRRVRLPRDESSTRLITLMRGPDDRWRVSSVSDT